MFQACSNTQQFLSQNLDDVMNQFVVPDTSNDEHFNEALQVTLSRIILIAVAS
jgi:hypothetical protein